MFRAPSLYLLAGCMLLAAPLFAREWTDKSGKYKLDADFVKLEDGIVHLKKKKDGQVVKVPLDRLRAADQQYALDEHEESLAGDAPDWQAVEALTLKELHGFVKRSRRAKEIHASYDLFINSNLTSEEEKELARSEIKKWEPLATIDAVKLGRHYLPPDEVKDRQERAERLVQEATRILSTRVDAAADDKLKEASKLDPDSMQPDLVRGIIWAVFNHKSKDADKLFTTAVGRGRRQAATLDAVGESNYVAALNNLALCKVRQGNLGSALSCWNEMLTVRARPANEVIQNIGRARALVAAGKGSKNPMYLQASKGLTKRIDKLYGSLAAAKDVVPFEPHTGWLYMPPILSDAEEEPKPGLQPRHAEAVDNNRMHVAGWGTGFVVAPGYVLTNRHVVMNDRLHRTYPGFWLQQADSLGERHFGKVVAVSRKFDLALIRCNALNADPIPLLDRSPRLSQDIMVLGFPRPDALGFRFTTTTGIISSMPNNHVSQVLYDAITKRGNSGGPTVDPRGNVVAIHSIALIIRGENRDNYAGGVLCTDAIPFLRDRIPGYQPNTRGQKFASWASVTEQLDESVVAIEILAPKRDFSGYSDAFAEKRERRESWRALEDPWCMVCSGWGFNECSNKKCKNGTVRSFRWETISRPGFPDEQSRIPIRVPCRTCGGGDKIRCRYCNEGYAP